MVFDAAVVVLYAVIADPQDADAKIGVWLIPLQKTSPQLLPGLSASPMT
jgi:hypothetical protein